MRKKIKCGAISAGGTTFLTHQHLFLAKKMIKNFIGLMAISGNQESSLEDKSQQNQLKPLRKCYIAELGLFRSFT